MDSKTEDLMVQLQQSGYKFLGIANNWIERTSGSVIWPKEITDCGEHKKRHISNGHKGTDNLTICDQCKIYWTYDSSD